MSEEEIRFTPIYKQGFDTSCGIAVSASLLNIYWNISVNEEDLYKNMINLDTIDAMGNYTVSMKTIMDGLLMYGVQSRAYSMDWETLDDTLKKGYSPIVVHLEKPRPHFVLLLNINDEYAFSADPARGYGLVKKTEFLQNYSGNALLTASREVVKNEQVIEKSVKEAQLKLEKLKKLARLRGKLL
jgi:predicted double-glycine peptidase